MADTSTFICDGCGNKCLLITSGSNLKLPCICPWHNVVGKKVPEWHELTLKGVDE